MVNASESDAIRISDRMEHPMHSQTQTQTHRLGTTISAEMGARRPKLSRTERVEGQRLVMVAIGEYVKTNDVPPLDRGLRSIVTQQVGNLLAGGWSVTEIKAQALSILSQFNLASGHKLMTQLQRTMEFADESARIADHETRKKHDRVAPDVAAALPSKAMPETRRNHPNNHRFEWDSSDSCRICGGPPGVHVRRVTEVSA